MRRRRFLSASLALAGSAILHSKRVACFSQLIESSPARPAGPPTPTGRPSTGRRRSSFAGRRARPQRSAVRKLLADPFYIGDQPGLTEISGWLDAWRSAPSAYVVAAESAADVAAAIRFAASHNLRLVVKGVGHSYLGALQRAGFAADLDPAA